MIGKLIWNDAKQNKLLSGATVFFMAACAMLGALTVLLLGGLTGAIDALADRAQLPDYMQMHTGDGGLTASEADAWAQTEAEIARFAESCADVRQWQVCRFLNLDNSMITLGGQRLSDSTQDNGLAMQGVRFDYLLDMENRPAEVLPGEVYVPVCYRARYHLSVGDTMTVESPAAAGTGRRTLVIAGFLRDAQMNSMMASSKRFLVNEADYESIKESFSVGNAEAGGAASCTEEYLIEFLLRDTANVNAFEAAYAAAGLPANGPAITRPLIRMMNALSDGTMIFVIFLVSIAVLLIALICIRFMLSLQMERDRKEIGMLKALGIGRAALCRMYLAKYLLFSGCGALVGLGAAFALKAPLERQIRELYGAPGGGVWTGVSALLAVLCTEGVLLFYIRHFLKKMEGLSVLEALCPGQQSAAPGREYSTGRSAKRRVENTARGYGQDVLIGAVTAVCVFMVLVPQNLYRTVSAPSFVTYMGIGEGEIRMDVRQTGDIDAAALRLAAVLEQDTRVEKHALLRTGVCAAVLEDGSTVNLTVETGNHGIFPVRFSQGGPPTQEDEIALSSMNARELGVSVGDKLRLGAGGNETAYTVCGIYSDITNGGKTAKACAAAGSGPAVWSVLYVSLKETVDREAWMEEYRRMGADVIDIAAYVTDTYSQTLEQLRLAAGVAFGAAVSVIAVVVLLFMRLIVERDRRLISLRKALGFTGRALRRVYFVKGMLPVTVGIIAGLLLGCVCGGQLCGAVMASFGAEGFRFAAASVKELLTLWALLTLTGAAAVLIGTRPIRDVEACECCRY